MVVAVEGGSTEDEVEEEHKRTKYFENPNTSKSRYQCA